MSGLQKFLRVVNTGLLIHSKVKKLNNTAGAVDEEDQEIKALKRELELDKLRRQVAAIREDDS